MTAALVIAAVAYIAFKCGEAKEIMRSLGRRFEGEPLDSPRAVTPPRMSENGSPGSDATAPSPSILYDQAGDEPEGLYLLLPEASE